MEDQFFKYAMILVGVVVIGILLGFGYKALGGTLIHDSSISALSQEAKVAMFKIEEMCEACLSEKNVERECKLLHLELLKGELRQKDFSDKVFLYSSLYPGTYTLKIENTNGTCVIRQLEALFSACRDYDGDEETCQDNEDKCQWLPPPEEKCIAKHCGPISNCTELVSKACCNEYDWSCVWYQDTQRCSEQVDLMHGCPGSCSDLDKLCCRHRDDQCAWTGASCMEKPCTSADTCLTSADCACQQCCPGCLGSNDQGCCPAGLKICGDECKEIVYPLLGENDACACDAECGVSLSCDATGHCCNDDMEWNPSSGQCELTGLFRLVLVPINYNFPGEKGKYEQNARNFYNYWTKNSPFKNCPKREEMLLLDEDCSNAVSKCKGPGGNMCNSGCANAVINCARAKYGAEFDKAEGILNGPSGSGGLLGCASISNLGVPPHLGSRYGGAVHETARGNGQGQGNTHELGHDWGLCHTPNLARPAQCPNDDPANNAFVMNYGTKEYFGPEAYAHLDPHPYLEEALEGCT